jgi:hypothetical protein
MRLDALDEIVRLVDARLEANRRAQPVAAAAVGQERKRA